MHLPRTIFIASALFTCNSVLLILWWLVFSEDVQSNGAQVFFIVLWISAAWGLRAGEGWIRAGVVCLLIAYVWGLINQPSILEGLAKINLADQLSKLLALVAVILLYLPGANRWFKSRRVVEL